MIEADFAPSGKSIGAVVREGRYQHLYLLSTEGKIERRLTEGQRIDRYPVFSPDGEQIAFESVAKSGTRSGRESSIYVVNVDGTEMRQISPPGLNAYRAQFFPSGHAILFEGGGDLYRVQLDTEVAERLTEMPGYATHATIVPDEENVLFWHGRWFGHSSPIAAERWHDFEMYRLHLTSRGIQPLGSKEYYGLDAVVASPTKDTFLLYTGPGVWLIMDLSNPAMTRRLAPSDRDYELKYGLDSSGRQIYRSVYEPNFIRGGECILFTSPAFRYGGIDSNDMDLYTVDLATSQTHRLTNLKMNIRQPRVSPLEDTVLFLVDPTPINSIYAFQLWTMDIDGSNAKQVTFFE